jgi:hypothetical protein
MPQSDGGLLMSLLLFFQSSSPAGDINTLPKRSASLSFGNAWRAVTHPPNNATLVFDRGASLGLFGVPDAAPGAFKPYWIVRSRLIGGGVI